MVIKNIVLGIGAVFLVFVILNYFHILSIPFLPQSPHTMNTVVQSTIPGVSQQNTKTQILPEKNICIQQYSGYPEITDILTTKANQNLGIYQGQVKNVNTVEQSLTIASIPNGHVFVFRVQAPLPTIYDMHHTLLTGIRTIPADAKAVISFPCLQQNNSFQLTQIQLIQ